MRPRFPPVLRWHPPRGVPARTAAPGAGVDEARKQYAESVEMMMKDNKMDKYMSGLIFTPPANAGFADEPFGAMGTSGKK